MNTTPYDLFQYSSDLNELSALAAKNEIIAQNRRIDCIEGCMVSITIRNLDQALKSRLRVRTAQHGRSMEKEARDILRTALAVEHQAPHNLAEAIHRRFAALERVDLPSVSRDAMRKPLIPEE